MQRDLPPRANLDHLRKQAKDLLDAQRRGEPEALARIRASLPSFAAMTDAAIAAAPFALHDAQSAIAREYGKASWAELRDAVAAQATDGGPSDALLRALMPLPFPPEIGKLLREASTRPAQATEDTRISASLPLVAVRNAIFMPGALGPIHVARPSSRAALEVALERAPSRLAVFAQHAPEDESADTSSLHPIGCEVHVHAVHPDGPDRLWAVLEGVRWIKVESIEAGPRGSSTARVSPVLLDPGDPGEVARLAASLRALARNLASAFPDGAHLVKRIDAAAPDRLADLVVVNLPVSVDEKAAYAAEPRLPERLRLAHAMAERRVPG
jgi:Lon protease-like protein